MSHQPHCSDYETLGDAIVAFAQLGRENGLNIGVQETLEAVEVARDDSLLDREYLRFGLQAVMCTSKNDIPRYQALFDTFWHTSGSMLRSKTTYKNKSNLRKRSASSLVMLGEGNSEGDLKDSHNTSGANAAERLRKTDFTKVAEIDSAYLEELALRLWRQMSLRMKRRMTKDSRGRRIDLRSTIRRNIGHGGDLIELSMKDRKPRKHRLIVLLDVSGSMDKYSYYLLRFIWTLRSFFESVEAYIFSTSLVRITPFLDTGDLFTTLAVMSAKAHNWSSGTKIGACFGEFNERYAKQVLNGSSTVIVLSDGLDTGNPETLSMELRKIRMRTRRVIWLNPLKGMQNYEPVQRGMSAALDEVDVFSSAHNLDSLLELEEYLMDI